MEYYLKTGHRYDLRIKMVFHKQINRAPLRQQWWHHAVHSFMSQGNFRLKGETFEQLCCCLSWQDNTFTEVGLPLMYELNVCSVTDGRLS